MSIELTEEQCQALLKGEAVRLSPPEVGEPVVLLREDLYQALLEEQEDRRLQEAFLQASHTSALNWMKENPY